MKNNICPANSKSRLNRIINRHIQIEAIKEHKLRQTGTYSMEEILDILDKKIDNFFFINNL